MGSRSYLVDVVRASYKFSRVARTGVILGIVGGAIFLDNCVPRQDFAVRGISNVAGSPTTVLNTPGGSVASFHLATFIRIKSATIGTAVTGNSDSQPTFQLIVSGKELLAVPYGLDQFPLVVSDNLAPEVWHEVIVDGASNGSLSITLDGNIKRWSAVQIQQVQSSAQIGNRDFSYRFDAIGIGGAPFDGDIIIQNLSVTYTRSLPTGVSGVLSIIVILLIGLLFLPIMVGAQQFRMRSGDIMVGIFTAAGLIIGLVIDRIFPAARLMILPCMVAGTAIGITLARSFVVFVPAVVRRLGAPGAAIALVFSLTALPNAGSIGRMASHWPISTAAVVTGFVCGAILLLNTSLLFRSAASAVNWYALLPVPIFAMLALRSDALFSQINTLHWEYFAGPVRAIRQGGWLLWDVPSQYGFLNVLMTALVPEREAVNAVFLFQAATLFTTANVFYWSLVGTIRMRWIYAALIVVAFFFLSDPLLIGPEAYPSMSAVRFIWCYVILALALACFMKRRADTTRFVLYGGIAWVVGMLWSGESAVYSSALYFGTVLMASRLASPGRSKAEVIRRALSLAAMPLGAFLLVIIAIQSIYLSLLHHAPDWSMYFMYILSYGAGYGQIGISPTGPIWVLAEICVGTGSAAVIYLHRGNRGPLLAIVVSALMAAIVSTYYLGRAFPIVLTMISPLLVYSIVAIVRVSARTGTQSLLAVLSVPFLALGLASAFWNVNSINVLERALNISLTPASHYPPADPDLIALLQAAHITPKDNLVYYDSWVGMPTGALRTFERTWLPAPLQALEKPISNRERDRIIWRYVVARRQSGYFVQALGPTNQPEDARSWLALFSRLGYVRLIEHDDKYRVYTFVPWQMEPAWQE